MKGRPKNREKLPTCGYRGCEYKVCVPGRRYCAKCTRIVEPMRRRLVREAMSYAREKQLRDRVEKHAALQSEALYLKRHDAFMREWRKSNPPSDWLEEKGEG